MTLIDPQISFSGGFSTNKQYKNSSQETTSSSSVFVTRRKSIWRELLPAMPAYGTAASLCLTLSCLHAFSFVAVFCNPAPKNADDSQVLHLFGRDVFRPS